MLICYKNCLWQLERFVCMITIGEVDHINACLGLGCETPWLAIFHVLSVNGPKSSLLPLTHSTLGQTG